MESLHTKHTFPRSKKVEKTFLDILNEFFTKEINWPENLFVSISKVRLNDKMTYLDIEISTYGEESANQAQNIINDHAYYIRSYCAKRIHLKYMPEIRFHSDRTVQETLKWSQLSTE